MWTRGAPRRHCARDAHGATAKHVPKRQVVADYATADWLLPVPFRLETTANISLALSTLKSFSSSSVGVFFLVGRTGVHDYGDSEAAQPHGAFTATAREGTLSHDRSGPQET